MVVGGFVVAFSMVSLLVKQKLYINEVVLGTACGVIFGPYCANIFNPRSWGGDINTITLEVTRITLAAGLFAIGVELPQSYLADHAKGLLVMVVPTMAFGWIVVASITFVVFPPLNFISSLVIAACLTPTDPIISAAIVGGKFATKHVPLNLRRILAAESAANDGLAYPFLSLSVYLTTESSRRVAIGKWFLIGWLYQVILGTIIGAVLGIAFSHLMKFSHRKGFIDRESYVAQYLALALFTIGVTRTLGSDDLLAAFAAGSAISWDGYFNTQIEDEVFSSVIDLVLNCGCFVYIGAWMPFNMFNATELGITPWRLAVLFVAVLLLRRFPPLLLLYKWVPEITSWKEALFSGHFGPMGVGAIFISTLAVTELPTPHSPPQNQAEILAATLQTIVSFIVLGSIIIHGLSIPFFSFGRNVRSRTVSLTRTWTTRNALQPDWVLWARRTPAGSTRPGTPVSENRDVERGLERKVDPAGLTEPPIVSQSEAAQRDHHTPELGPAAVISDATAGPAAIAESDRDLPPPSGKGTPVQVSDKAPSEESNVNLKPDAAGNSGARLGSGPPSSIHAQNASNASSVRLRASPSPNGSHLRVALPSDGGEEQAERVSRPGSPLDTPTLQRFVRSPLPFVDDAAADRVPSGVQTPTSVKAVRFPDDVVGASEEDTKGPLSPGDEVGGEAVAASNGGGGAPQGKNVHFPASQ
ncbi:Sodium/hydrogen exchanger family-domain-containing protein [Trametes punicea]|nr:Sodium/hydrogen exchanger family-domain-containing protein [Trametes punicea]